MWLWIWACVGRTFIPDIFYTNNTAKKKQTPSHKHENTTTPPPHKHHQTDATTKTQLHNTTPRTTHTPTHTYTGTQKLSNPCEAVWFHMYLRDNMWRSHRKGHRSRSTFVRGDQLKKKAFISLKAKAAACLFLLAGRSRSAEQDTDILFAGKIYSWYAKFKTTLEVLYKGFASSILWRVCGLDQNRHRLIGLCPSKTSSSKASSASYPKDACI